MKIKNKLIEPDENSITRFEPFYQITPKELDEICKQYHKEQLMLGDVVGRGEQLVCNSYYANNLSLQKECLNCGKLSTEH